MDDFAVAPLSDRDPRWPVVLSLDSWPAAAVPHGCDATPRDAEPVQRHLLTEGPCSWLARGRRPGVAVDLQADGNTYHGAKH
jgi:hypothetical protein